jgi:hypothetical protein
MTDEKNSSDFLSDAKIKALDVWKQSPNLVVIVIGLVLLCSTCCLCGGCVTMLATLSGPSSSAGSSSDSGYSSNRGGMTKEEFRTALRDLGWSGLNDMQGIQGVIPEDKFFSRFGKPVRTQTLGDHNFWYYKCEDGTVQVVKSSVFGQGHGNDEAGTIYLHAVNDY